MSHGDNTAKFSSLGEDNGGALPWTQMMENKNMLRYVIEWYGLIIYLRWLIIVKTSLGKKGVQIWQKMSKNGYWE